MAVTTITKTVFKEIAKRRVKSELRVLRARIKLSTARTAYESR